MGQEGTYTWTLGNFYVAVVQVILLFGLETWVVTPNIKRISGRFYHSLARPILEKMPLQRMEGMWEYPTLGGATRAAGIEGIKTYISRRQNTVAQYIANLPIMDICLDT